MSRSTAAALAKEFIRTESTNPGSFESGMTELILELLAGSAPNVDLETDEVFPGRSNIKAEIAGDRPDLPALTFICHMDTVPAGSGWTHAPFAADESDGMIFGRGSCDMKSGLACCLSAFLYASSLFSEKSPLHTLRFICTVDEEGDMRGVEKCISSGWVNGSDWIIDAEPTGGLIRNSHKGRIWYEIEIEGKAAHASMPEEGIDSVAAASEMISFIRDGVNNSPVCPGMGRSTATFGRIEGGTTPYLVPESCRFWVDIRTVPPMDSRKVSNIIDEAALHTAEIFPGIRITPAVTGDRPYIDENPASPLLGALSRAAEHVTGSRPLTGCFTGYTDTAVIAGALGNRNCMSYGPGKLELAHKPDEYVTVDDVLRCEKVFRSLIDLLLAPGI